MELRAFITYWKSKIIVVSGVISATESELNQNVSIFFRLLLRLRRLRSAYIWSCENHWDCRSRNDKPITVQIPSFVIGLVLPLLLATPTNQFSLDRKNGVVSGILQFYFLPGCRTCKTTTTTTTTTTTEAVKKGDNRTKKVTRSSGKNSITKESFFLAKIMNACFTTRSAFTHKGG